MCANRRAVLLLLLAAPGCAATRGPSGYLQPARIAQREAHGGWITLDMREARVDGELIAVEAESVFVLTPEGLRVVHRDSVRSAVLGAYDSQSGQPAVWTMGGALTTASHGLGAIGTFPLWIITGSLMTASVSRGPLHTVSQNRLQDPRQRDRARTRWAAIALWARFPAGMPRGLDRATLRSRGVIRSPR
jgi:hypothetical protein